MAFACATLFVCGCSRSTSEGCQGEGACVDGAPSDLALPDLAQAPPADLAEPQDAEAPPDLTLVRTWVQVPSGTTEDLHKIWGSSPNDIYIVGTHGTILHSNNGMAWQALASGTMNWLSDVGGTGPGHVYAVGTNIILHSIDGGKTWPQEQNPPQPYGCCQSVDVLGTDVFTTGGGNASVAHNSTLTPGAPWTQIHPFGGYDFEAALPLRSGRLLVAGHDFNREIVYTDDLGKSWTTAKFDFDKEDTVFEMWAASEQEVFAGTAKGEILRSLNGGMNWTTLVAKPMNNTQSCDDIWGSSATDIYAAERGSTILHSSDHGKTWQSQPVPLPGDIQLGGIWGYDLETVYVVGTRGTILRLQ